jgi:hypothetical protein
MTHTRININGQRYIVTPKAQIHPDHQLQVAAYQEASRQIESKSSLRRGRRLSAKIRHAIKTCTCAAYGPDSCRSCSSF